MQIMNEKEKLIHYCPLIIRQSYPWYTVCDELKGEMKT